MMGMLFSCENDLGTITTVTTTDDSADEVVNGMHTLFSDSGIVMYEIIATRMEKFNEPKRVTVFKDGFTLNIFKEKDSVITQIKADYGEIRERENMVIARNNVIFTNFETNQKLMTEELYWDQVAKRVKTEKRFHVIGEDTEVWGYGLDTDENFTDYNAHKVSMTKTIEQENDTIQ